MVNPVEVRVPVAEMITGGPAFTRVAEVGAGDGVTSTPSAVSLAVTVMVPATVPVCRSTVVELVSDPAGMVSVAVLPPVANCTAGSTGPESGLSVSVSVTCTSVG